MKHILCLFITCTVSFNITAQKTVRLDAVKSNDYGVAYTLPKTAIVVTANYKKVTKSAGEFHMYAERYLYINDAITENSTRYMLNNIEAKTIGVPNKEESYLVEFRPNSAASYITLTTDGLLCAINDNYTFSEEKPTEVKEKQKLIKANPKQYLSEEMLRAGSTAKQAELIAKQIYKLRESRNDILTGDAENMPPDGDAYRLVVQQLDDQESALTSLFIGEQSEETITKTITINLDDKDIEERIVARFSQHMGIVEANDLSGEAIYLSLKAKDAKQAPLLSPKDAKDMEKKFERGIIYNIPGKATLLVEYKNKNYVNMSCDIIQFGTQDVLDNKLFGDKNSPLKVVFYPELGSIKGTGIAASN